MRKTFVFILLALAVSGLCLAGCYKEARVAPLSPTVPPEEWTPIPPTTTPTATPEPTPTVAGQIYVVQEGDTLWSISQMFGTTMEAIMAANAMENPDDLQVGREILIPY